MVNIIAFLIVLIVLGSFLMLLPTSIPKEIAEFGAPIFSAGLIGIVMFAILKYFRVV